MRALAFDSVCLSFDGNVSLFDRVSARFERGWTGVVGGNGSGKSTLLRLLAGELRPDAGVVRRDDLRVASASQTLEVVDDATWSFAWAQDAQARRLRARLRLDPDGLDRWATLSPGERRRWNVGAAVSLEPDALLLDEPTNDVDGEGRAWLVDVLASYDGIGVLVSHDRALLDVLTTRTARLIDARIEVKPLAYSAARREWERERHERERDSEAQKRTVRVLSRRLSDQRRDRASMERERSGARRRRNEHDSDSRGIGAQNLVDWAEARQARRVAVTRKALDRANDAVTRVEIDVELGRSVFARWERAAQPVLATIGEDEIRAGDRVLLREVRLQWRREDRIALTGPNGAGKSTLVRHVLSRLSLPSERTLVLPQELSRAECLADLAEVRALGGEARGRVLQVVAALGVAPERLLATTQPSPGEARKLRLALGLGRQVAALVLDEPTNYLDLPSIERIEAALAAFPGAIFMVTHDAPLAARIAHTEWKIEHGRVRSVAVSR